MKEPLLFSLFAWIVLFALPWTRPTAILDWRGATLERGRGWNPSFAPLDAPYQPEKDVAAMYMGYGGSPPSKDDVADDMKANGLRVAPQFASVARFKRPRCAFVVRAFIERNAGARPGGIF